MKLIRYTTYPKVKFPHCCIVSYDGDGKDFRKEIVSQYKQGHFSCTIERYTSTAIVHFREEEDAAHFLMRVN
ncbi:hypothetical protein N8344_01330 [bacterium]|nr:hypothetical protein [bacterium]